MQRHRRSWFQSIWRDGSAEHLHPQYLLPSCLPPGLLAAAIIHVVAANHYKTLGVPRDATAEAIKASYKGIALKSHPDKVPKSASAATRQASQRRFEEANAAFEVLSDPAQRRQYDFELEHPMSRGEDGVFRHGAAPGEAAIDISNGTFCWDACSPSWCFTP